MTWQKTIEEAAPSVKAEKMDQLVARITGALEKAGVEPAQDRLLQGDRHLGDRLDVTEEMTRLAGHLSRLDALTRQDGEVGKHLDFLIQEAFREINTCGNKARTCPSAAW